VLACGTTTTALVPAAVEVEDVQGSLLIMHSFRFHGLVLKDRLVVLTEIGNFLVFGGSWFQCKSRPIMNVMLQTRARTQDLRFLQQY